MNADNWKRVKEIFREVLDVEPSKRQIFLKKAELPAEILSEVESLLAFEKESEDFMSLSIVEFSKDFTETPEESEEVLAGQRIGIYEIVREIGYGGMGTVYLATRADGKFEQKVALKLLRREMNTSVLRRRFQKEREILASLEHHNIARILDAGKTADKIPYIAMEFVEGVPIDRFCNNEKLTLDARLKLFNKVCEAVAYAHRNLIIHRDLKPSNILVTKEGEPKLLDFGISKLLGANDADERTSMTMLGAMTPEYASPEQIKGESVTTATDIYSLGVVLYKILTGSYPYNFKNKSNGNLLKEITDSEPLRPSLAVNSTNDKTNPESRIPNPKSLAGDIDIIILKSLRKEPARRYATVEQFSADIWRFIDGLPILARPATFGYRAYKFFKRNKISVIAAALILLSLITGIIVAARQTKIANEQAEIAVESKLVAEREADKAKIEQEKSEKISRFMAKVISYANPAWYAEGSKFGGDVKLIDVLNDLSDKIDIEFADQPDVQAELHHKFTEVYNASKAGVTDRARLANLWDKQNFHARRALELRRKFYGEKHELVAKDMYYLYYAKLQERHDAELLARAIEMMRETNTMNLNFPYMLSDYAGLLMAPKFQELHEKYRQAAIPPTGENKYRLGEDYSREALHFYRIHYTEDNVAIGQSECYLAYALAKQNKMTDFQPHFDVCRDLMKKFPFDSDLEFLKPIENALAENAGKVSN